LRTVKLNGADRMTGNDSVSCCYRSWIAVKPGPVFGLEHISSSAAVLACSQAAMRD
jgi:hypothetical protein